VEADAERERAAAAHAARDASLLALQADRAALFAGRPAAAAEVEITAQLGACRAAREAAAALLQQCALEVTRCSESRDGASARLTETLAAAQACEARSADWLAQHNGCRTQALDLAGLGDLLAHGADWIRAEREALSALDAALGAADAVLRERERRAEAHLAARAASWSESPEAELEPALAALSSQRQAQQDQASALALALSADDARRCEAAAMQRQLEQQQAAQRRWAQLSDLIGSADGKKFRNYAQQTTLDVLLAYANRHLADLSRRYRLERVRDTLALMVVDQDMAEEMRSVHSLSGGESFLVSLALALGLASLSSNQVRVESLFIDEGFGSLDAETLRVAMDALDGLQALGRKVGVISHVQEMTERIATRILVRRTAGGSSKVSVSQGS
jgi:exonuclease SbcC